MALWLKLVLVSLTTLGLGVGAASWLGSVHWDRTSSQARERLASAAEAYETKTVSFETLDRLPTPVANYFRWALTDGQKIPKLTRIEHEGEFRLRGEGEKGWSPFTSVQVFSTRPSGFIWDATIRMASVLPVRVRDTYAEEQGSMQGRILAVIPVVDEAGGEELSSGALQRYLAEAVWFPSALLPECGVKWSPIDDRRALATLTDGSNSVSLEFRFAESGAVDSVFSPGRFYQEGPGQYSLHPWEGFFWDYEERDGVMVPLQGEVRWNLPAGPQEYWRAQITRIEFDPDL